MPHYKIKKAKKGVNRQPNEKVEYSVTKGAVVGNLWGGGRGYYPSRKYVNTDLEALKQEINKDFKSGAIDSGMGYEKVTGAIVYITKKTTKTMNGKPFVNEEVKTYKLGDIDEEDENLNEMIFNQ